MMMKKITRPTLRYGSVKRANKQGVGRTFPQYPQGTPSAVLENQVTIWANQG